MSTARMGRRTAAPCEGLAPGTVLQLLPVRPVAPPAPPPGPAPAPARQTAVTPSAVSTQSYALGHGVASLHTRVQNRSPGPRSAQSALTQSFAASQSAPSPPRPPPG